jgi:hypothetical protein
VPAVVVLGFGCLFVGILVAAALQIRAAMRKPPGDGPAGPAGPPEAGPGAIDSVDAGSPS